jgi:hypothetical protein
MQKSIIVFSVCTVVALSQYGCGKKEAAASSSTTLPAPITQDSPVQEQKKEEKNIVCVWDGVPVRQTPSKSGKYLSAITLGETITDLEESVKDSTDKNREYYKVMLSDGKQGWAPTYGLIKNATIGVAKADISLYKRPDLLTITDNKLKAMEFIAVTNTKEDWIEILGEQKKKTGWIKKDAITTNKEDITTSILINKKLAANDGLSKLDKYKAIVAQAPYPGSVFIENINSQIAELTAVVAEVPPAAIVEETSTTEDDSEASE